MPRIADQPLVGRAAELEVVDLVLGDLRRGTSAALLVQGEPGIGKTRLLAALAGRADADGCTVLEGGASELESDLPFWVFVDALDDYVAGLDPGLVSRLSDDARAELAHVLPSLSDLGAAAGPVLQDERYRVHRAMRELLERLAVRQPLVLVLDDVHWADPASVDLLAALLRSPPAASVLIVLAARPRQLDERLQGALDRADRQGALTRVELSGLPRAAVTELLGDDVGDARADQLYEDTGGNPFYLQQLVRSAGADGGGRSPSLEAVGVPAAVISSLSEELGLLAPATRRVLEGAAVAGDPFDPDVAASAAGVDEGGALAAFDELLALGLIGSTDVPRRFRFRHPLVRRAVYESAPGGWRLGAHERAATVLGERGAPATARAHHVEFAARQGDQAAIGVLTEAGSAALNRAPASAAGWFSAALRILPAAAPDEQRVGLLVSRARALAAQGRLTESYADLLESVALAPSVELATFCAGIERLLGRHDEAHARLRASLDQMPDPAAPEAIALMIELAVDALFRAQPEAVREWARRALAAARELGDGPLIVSAASMLTLGHAVAGDIAEAEEAYAEAATLVAGLSDAALGTRVGAAAYLCSAATFLDRYDEACAHGERALRAGRAAGHLHPTLLPALGAAHTMRGRLAEAAKILDAGVEAARLAGITQSLAWMLRNRSWLSIASGDVAGALALAEEAHALTDQLDESILTSWAAMSVARAAVLSGDARRAVAVLDRDALEAIPGVWRTIGHEALTLAYLDLGRPDDAAAEVNEAQAHASALGLPLANAWAQRAAAAVALHAGEPAAAAELALASVADAERAGAVIEAEFSRTLAGRALAQAGDEDAAGEALARAAAAFAAAGAYAHRDAADQELRRLGRKVHHRSRAGVRGGEGIESLTGRELQIAALVVDRRTNQEIADQLFLSTKTIETHMRNMFRKLDVSSRIELARAVERAQP